MLPLWLESFLTPCPRPVRALGYLQEALAIRSCYSRCCYAWAPHLKRSREVILAAMAECATRRTAVVFGSGMLYDVPMDELAAAFREVVLVDIVHLRDARRRVRRWPNVRLYSADVTGTVEEVYRVAHLPGVPLPRAAPVLFLDAPEVDLVASVNLLPQLPYLPVAYLVRAGVHAADAMDAYARDVVRAHLEYLQRLPGTVALIADVEETRISPTARTLDRTSTLHGMALPWRGAEWTWHLLPRAEAGTRPALERRVVGIVNVKRCDG